MIASRGGTRRCEACAKDVHDLTALAPAAASARLLFQRERSVCARLAVASAIGALAVACSSPRDPIAPGADEARAADEEPHAMAVAAPGTSADGGLAAEAGIDSDMDGIPDAVDACPSVPGPASADAAKNGCPKLVVVETMGIVIIPQLLFARGKVDVPSASQPVLDSVVDVLKARPEIKRIEIEGHASTDEARPQALSEGRARAILQKLVRAGIDPARLVVTGYGTTKPIDANATAEGRAHNRRVTFHVLETSDGACPFPGVDGGAPGSAADGT